MPGRALPNLRLLAKKRTHGSYWSAYGDQKLTGATSMSAMAVPGGVANGSSIFLHSFFPHNMFLVFGFCPATTVHTSRVFGLAISRPLPFRQREESEHIPPGFTMGRRPHVGGRRIGDRTDRSDPTDPSDFRPPTSDLRLPVSGITRYPLMAAWYWKHP